jgi:hypothetical protein
MPPCKNDSKRSYRGTEPSPKGLGYCAHACPENTRKKGRDGHVWHVQATRQAVKRWVKRRDKSRSPSSKAHSNPRAPDPQLLFVEPVSYSGGIPTGPMQKPFTVTRAFYERIRHRPPKMKRPAPQDRGQDNSTPYKSE